MANKKLSSRSAMALVPTCKKESANSPLSNLHTKRSAVDFSEDEDARLTGMTRSLVRRLLALNLQPVSPTDAVTYMKVA